MVCKSEAWHKIGAYGNFIDFIIYFISTSSLMSRVKDNAKYISLFHDL